MKYFLFTYLALLFGCSNLENKEKAENAPLYEPNWESLAGHNEEPDWIKDAKFGIYFHWGVYTVPAYGSEWYPRWMHISDDSTRWNQGTTNVDVRKSIYNHHLKTYGHPSKFGYHDFIPMFKAEKFDPEAWAELFLNPHYS